MACLTRLYTVSLIDIVFTHHTIQIRSIHNGKEGGGEDEQFRGHSSAPLNIQVQIKGNMYIWFPHEHSLK